jgi:hypothetical protein
MSNFPSTLFTHQKKHMKQPQIVDIAVRALEIPVASLRYVATPRICLRNANGSGREISLAQYFGLTPEDAQEKAEEALKAWKMQK